MSVDSASGCGIGPGSKMVTSWPRSESSIAAVRPKMPPPQTLTRMSLVVRDAHPRDQLAQLRVVDGGDLAHDGLACGAGRRRWQRLLGARLPARGRHDDGVLVAAPREAELEVVEQARLAEPLDEVREQLRAQQVELLQPGRG